MKMNKDFPSNLMSNLFLNPPNEVSPVLFEETLEYVMYTHLTSYEQKVINARYKDGRSLQSIANDNNVTRQAIHQTLRKALSKLSEPNCINALSQGIGISKLNETLYEQIPKAVDIDIKSFGLSIRSENALRDAGYETVQDLLDKTRCDLMRIKGLGVKSCREIENKLKLYGFKTKRDLAYDINILMSRYNLDKKQLIKCIEVII